MAAVVHSARIASNSRTAAADNAAVGVADAERVPTGQDASNRRLLETVVGSAPVAV